MSYRRFDVFTKQIVSKTLKIFPLQREKAISLSAGALGHPVQATVVFHTRAHGCTESLNFPVTC